MKLALIKKNDNLEHPFWNLSSNVGVGCPNKTEDVQLVQFGYYAMGKNLKSPPPPALRAIYSAVVPEASYNGKENEPLTLAIRAHQKHRGGPQDGRVSVMTGATYDGSHIFAILVLNNNMFDVLSDDFPRLDKHPRCPPEVRAAVKRHCAM